MILKNLEENINAAIYCRLSIDDGDLKESQSIENQKNILTNYCLNNNFNIINIYIDDGYTGTNFNRPGFIKMMDDINKGLINLVITKDLSRLGRNYLDVGNYLERIFPTKNIRYISISDNVDTASNIDEFIAFRNIMNEMYAKDISKKIRTTIKYQIENGVYKKTSVPLYGYTHNSSLNKRIINQETAPVVKIIFNLYINNYSINDICKYLYNNKVFTPKAYIYNKWNKDYKGNPYSWNPSTIYSILNNQEYLGHYIKGKTIKQFKINKIYKIPKENQYIFKNIFEPIISEELFNKVQLKLQEKRICK